MTPFLTLEGKRALITSGTHSVGGATVGLSTRRLMSFLVPPTGAMEAYPPK